MANPIAFNNGSTPTGSIKRATISVGVSGEDYSNLGGLTWYNGIEAPGKYIIYSDTYSQGSSTLGNAKPTAWGTTDTTDASLLGLINALPARQGQSRFTTLTDAVNWLQGTGQYIIIGENIQSFVTDSLKVYVDSQNATSYPKAGSTWYDVSGNSKDGSLTNSPSFNGYSFVLDGTDDYVQVMQSGDLSAQDWSFEWTAKQITTSHRHTYWGLSNAGSNAFTVQNFQRWDNGAYVSFSGNNTTYQSISYSGRSSLEWNHFLIVNTPTSVKYYQNGALKYTYNNPQRAVFDRIWLGMRNIGNQHINAEFTNFRAYNKALTVSEVKYNYYSGNIVTTGLTFNFDSSSPVSYPRSGTGVTDMVTETAGTLVNGPSFSATNQNSLYFDGSDDYIEWGRVTGTEFQYSDSFTIEVWYKPTGNGNYIFTNRKSTSLNYSGWAIYQNGVGQIQCWVGGYPNNQYGWKRVFAYTQNNTWVHVVYVNTPAAGSQTVYVNGVKAGFNANEDAAYQNSYIDYTATPYHVPVIGTSPADGYTQNGNFNLAVARVYNTALTEAQANQNFNAQRMRFGL